MEGYRMGSVWSTGPTILVNYETVTDLGLVIICYSLWYASFDMIYDYRIVIDMFTCLVVDADLWQWLYPVA